VFLIGIDYIPVLIANGTAISAATPLGAKTLVGLSMPAAWTAAGLSFQVSPDGGTTWQELVDTTGAAISFTVAAATFMQVTPSSWRGVNMIKVRSGTSGSPVNQGADRTLTLAVRPEMI
jgi:hypothetical protein